MSTNTRAPTIDDLRVKLCFICREEERYDNPEEPRRAWVHPCACTLVAHESCLLDWIKAAQQDPARAKNALKCPQCGARYEIESDNPFLLRLLDNLNVSVSHTGRFVVLAGLAGVVVSFGFGVYVMLTSYGAYALHEFIGKEMYDLILTDDPSNWPWHAYFNLPLIPISLVLSRTRFLDTLPIIPLLLAWPSSPPVPSLEGFISSVWNGTVPGKGAKRNAAAGPVFTWPPSPFLATFGFPVVTALYRRWHARLKHYVLDVPPTVQGPIGEIVWDIVADGALQARVGMNVDRGQQQQQQQQQQEQQVQGEQGGANDGAQQDNDGGEIAIRITTLGVGRLLGGALLMPAIARWMGAGLLTLSRHSRLLRQFLAVRPPLRGSARRRALAGVWFDDPGQPWAEMSYARQIGTALRVGLNLVCGGTRLWYECDPVWWRNSIGLGIFIVAKDCLQLLHLYLAKREMESRHVKSRSFAGVDIRELDLIGP